MFSDKKIYVYLTIIAILIIGVAIYLGTGSKKEKLTIYTPHDLLKYYNNDVNKMIKDIREKGISENMLSNPSNYNQIAKQLGII